MTLQISLLKIKHPSLVMTCIILVCLCSNGTADEHQQTFKQEFPGVCDIACQEGIDAANTYTTTLHTEQGAYLDSLVERVSLLESDLNASIQQLNTLILEIIPNLEAYLSGNVSVLQTRISNDVSASYNDAMNQLDLARSDWSSRLNDLKLVVDNIKNNNPGPGTPTNPGDSNAAMQVYYNVTRRIDTLEYGKVSNLTLDNGIWRKNFRTINATFEKMKLNNNCLCK